MEISAPSRILIALAAFALFETRADAQEWLNLDPFYWESSTELETVKETLEGGDSTRDSEIVSGILFRQTGSVLDERIANFFVEVNPVMSRGMFETSITDETRQGQFLNFDVRLNLFEGAPVPFSGNILADRTTDTIETSLGNRTSFTSQNAYVAANWNNYAFPMTLSFEQRDLEQVFQSGLTSATSTRDETERTITLRGRSSKMSALVERNWHDDKVRETNQDYVTDRFRLQNYLRWGKGSRFNSRIDLFRRSGARAYDRFIVDESVTLQHTSSLSSSYSYGFTFFDQDVQTVDHLGQFSVTHQLYENLTTIFRAKARRHDFDVGTEDEYEARLDTDYRKNILWGGRVRAGLGGGYGVTKRTSAGGLSEVVDEAHGVTVSRQVVLAQQFIDITTIVVTDSAGIFVFTEGADYTIVQIANNFTQLNILSGGQIAVGDTILVSYKYEPLPAATFSSFPFQAHASVDFDWISIFARIDGEDQTLLSGEDEDAIIDRMNTSVGLELKWTGYDITASAGAEHRTFQSGEFTSSSVDFRQSFLYRPFPNLMFSANAFESFIDSDGTRTDFFSADAGLRWLPWSNLQIYPYAEAWQRDEKGVSNERYLAGGVDIDFSIGLFYLQLSYKHERRRGTVRGRDEDRIMLKLVRRSR